MWTLPLLGNDGLALYVILRMREWDAKEIFATRSDDLGPAFLVDVMALAEAGPAWIAGKDEEPVAVFGTALTWPGCWSMWMFATDKISKIGIPVTKLVKNAIVPDLIRGGAHRLECRSMEGHIDAQRWLETVGARREGGPLRRYGRGREDFHIYTWDCP